MTFVVVVAAGWLMLVAALVIVVVLSVYRCRFNVKLYIGSTMTTVTTMITKDENDDELFFHFSL
jgi:hypothetical protein